MNESLDIPLNNENLLTQDQVCAFLSISKPTLWRLCKKGELVPTHIPGRTKPVAMFKYQEVSDYKNRRAGAIAVVQPGAVERLPARAVRAELEQIAPALSPLFISLDEAARRSGLPRTLLRDLCEQANIGVQNYRRWYISWPALVKFAENLEVKPTRSL